MFEFEPHGGCSSGRFALVGVGSWSLNRFAVVRVLSSSSVLFQRCWCSSGRIALVRVDSSSLNRMAVVRVLSSSRVLYQRCWCSSGRFALVRVGSLSVQFGVPALELSTRTSNLNYQLELVT